MAVLLLIVSLLFFEEQIAFDPERLFKAQRHFRRERGVAIKQV